MITGHLPPSLALPLLLLPPVPASYTWLAIFSYRLQVISPPAPDPTPSPEVLRTQDAVRKLVFQARGLNNPSEKLFRQIKLFKNQFDNAE